MDTNFEFLSEEDRVWIDRAASQISERITLERLSEHVPAVKNVIDGLKSAADLARDATVLFQKYPPVVMFDPETGLTPDGHDKEEARNGLTEAVNAVRFIAMRYQ